MLGIIGVLYMAINKCWDEAQPIMAGDELQFAVWRMMDYKQMCRTSKSTIPSVSNSLLDNEIKLKCSSIVAALLTEEEKEAIMGKVAKMFVNRMEDFHQMGPDERTQAIKEAANNMTDESVNPMGGEVDIEELLNQWCDNTVNLYLFNQHLVSWQYHVQLKQKYTWNTYKFYV